MLELLGFIAWLIGLYIWVFILSAILSWLVAFNVINTSNRFVYSVGNALYRLTEPVLKPIRRYLPNLGGIDLSPVVAIIGLIFVQNVVVRGWLMRMFGGY
ncbi:MAG: YggT family protein [Alphaproteobacteria bacterium]|jgi:YggT family protein|nr:YggT family protein [Alphaproteobacteria bacterium]MDP6516595.1 YggT family protein [Alphaproteobacteria bacterium]